MDDEVLLTLAALAPRMWWEFMKPFAIRMLVTEIDAGIEERIEEWHLLWEFFPMEMNILDRMALAKRARVRSV